MSRLQIDRMRELPLLIQRARSVSEKLRLSRELRSLTEQYKQTRRASMQQNQRLTSTPPHII